MELLKKWRKRRRLRYIPLEFIYEPLYETLKAFDKDMPVGIKISKKEYHQQKTVPIAKALVYRSNYRGLHGVS
ncbi:MAG: hypothetical protein ACFFDF_18320 [Candidatus Odinarchaeota archaeon]